MAGGPVLMCTRQGHSEEGWFGAQDHETMCHKHQNLQRHLANVAHRSKKATMTCTHTPRSPQVTRKLQEQG